MSEPVEPDVQAMLESGWTIAGYSTCLGTMGTLTHHILMQHGTNLTIVTVNITGGSEDGRYANVVSPTPAKKKGWFG